MADIKQSQIEIKVSLVLIEQIQWLMKYKSAADEALSYLITNEKDAHAAKLMLNALNIGAHEQPAQHSARPTVLIDRRKLVSCPQCLFVFGIPWQEAAQHSVQSDGAYCTCENSNFFVSDLGLTCWSCKKLRR